MPPIKEFRLNDANVDFAQEMKSLVTEDAAAHRKSVSVKIQERGEAGQSIAKKQAPVAAAALQHDFHADASIDMRQSLAKAMGMDYVSLNDYPVIDYKVLRMLTADQAKQYRVLPLSYDADDRILRLAIADPSDPTVIDDLSLALGCVIEPVVAPEADIMDRINEHYGMGEETLDDLIDELSADGDTNVLTSLAGHVVDLTDVDSAVNAAPIVKLANLILLKAVEDRASDIHIEPFENLLRIRYRVDGVLREMESPPKKMQIGLVSRLKVLANLDIAEQRRPQDGRINLSLSDNREVELRVTSVPTVHGESIVMRVLDKTLMQKGIREIGMAQDMLDDFLHQIRKPNGIVLVTGPTGCGKTTTLYAAIGEVKTVEEKLITTEDPVEYQMEGIVQININESVGLTYGRCLRAILRQDPDRILVGEIRDLATAQISIQAALTGHLVFSTLHTNSAAGTVTRLIDMGIEPFLITSTLQAVIGQRLVRTICPSCREVYVPSDEELAEFNVTRNDVADLTFYHGHGCDECAFTGYRGRLGIFEYLRVTEEICDLILEQATSDDIHAMAIKQGMKSLRQDGWIKICMGLTTFREVAHHAPQEADMQVIDDKPASEDDVPGVAGPALRGLV